MDSQTKASYNKNAAAITKKHLAILPEKIYELVNAFFYKNEKTLDLAVPFSNYLSQ